MSNSWLVLPTDDVVAVTEKDQFTPAAIQKQAKAFFADPAPEPRFGYVGMRGFSVSVEDHAAALDVYTEVLGPPTHVEGEDIRGWRLGDAWFTLFAGNDGGPSNGDASLEMASPAEAERLHAALLAAGAMGEDPSDQIMYVPLRFCMATDPFGLQWIVYAPRT